MADLLRNKSSTAILILWLRLCKNSLKYICYIFLKVFALLRLKSKNFVTKFIT